MNIRFVQVKEESGTWKVELDDHVHFLGTTQSQAFKFAATLANKHGLGVAIYDGTEDTESANQGGS